MSHGFRPRCQEWGGLVEAINRLEGFSLEQHVNVVYSYPGGAVLVGSIHSDFQADPVSHWIAKYDHNYLWGGVNRAEVGYKALKEVLE